jgi:3-phenylpropionate/trans-cinnamate dioxygenase ferredoxin reductase subunit
VTGCAVAGIETGRGAATVSTADGNRHEADLVVAGIGIEPCTELASGAGLACENGIAVDEFARTSDPRIVAAGDCASHPNRFAGGARVRLESVQNAIDQAKTAALTLLGKPRAYDAVPWFWSDQYDVKLQMVGLSHGADAHVLRGDPGGHRFSVFYFRSGRLVAIDSVNRPADHMIGRRLLTAGTAMTPDQAADEGFDLKSLSRAPA